METASPLEHISDDDLLRSLAEIMGQSRSAEADLVAHIGEVDERRLYAREGSPSMFAYCTQVLHLGEAEAYLRITAARAARKHPLLLTLLRDGSLHLTGIALLAPHLTEANREEVLKRATHRSKKQIEELIAEIAPRPDVPPAMRKLPERASGTTARSMRPDRANVLELRPDGVAASRLAGFPVRPAVVQASAPARYKVQFTASAELRDKLQRLQALLRSQVPDGDLAAVIEQAVTEKIERLEARRFASTNSPRKALREIDTSPSSRHIPAAVRRAVRERDGDRCRYIDPQGRRCSERHRLEYHHRHPFGLGGDHSPQNLRLLCHAHNAYLAEHDYGRATQERYRRSEMALAPGPPGPS